MVARSRGGAVFDWFRGISGARGSMKVGNTTSWSDCGV
jgi:hypothetical protein